MKENGYKRMKNTIKRIMKYIYIISPKYFIISILLTIAIGFSSAMSIWATKLLINGIVEVSTSKSNKFMEIIIIYVAVNIFIQLIKSLNNYVTSKHQLKLEYKMSMDILNKCKFLGLKDFENSEIYNTLSRAKIEGQTKVYIAYRNILSIITQIASIISVAAIILSWNSYIFLLAFITPIISTLINTRIGYRNYKMRMERMNEVRKTTYINYLLTNNIACKEIKTYNVGSYLVNTFSKIKRKIQSQDLHITKIRTIWSMGLGLIDELISLFIIFKIVEMAMLGRILVGDTVAYIDSISIIQSNVSRFLKSLSEIYSDILYVEEFYKLLDLEVKDDYEIGIEIQEIREIEFKDVSYTYQGANNYTLSNINISICRGELIGIVGENGSGKTTFIKLLCGFYDNYKGEILINGIELRDINTNSLRKCMGIIFQDFNKYELTLRENIGFGNLDEIYNDNKILMSLEEVALKEKIGKFPNHLETQMGKWFDGEELSRGQWQRIALSRTFMRDADVYVLDEPTSSLDPISEKQIFSLAREKSKDKIGIFITHRVENIAEMNPKVIVFSEGRIIASGSNNELIENCEEYIRLLGLKEECI
ncbi:ABC transporter ATP-binding protein [Sporosalibacterium faouarense]|uniref:ABC transporter ATP-binding protein n=1 Tax=Sporosalibacterium faouarense TaxID=516123 RepID=UPI00141D3D85|nr:ABC transporter ATP-binding protein [Sporosalibacterium faouarense]MTI49025.1 ABC transporter ATP-binding protein [Bacillota bacterium]